MLVMRRNRSARAARTTVPAGLAGAAAVGALLLSGLAGPAQAAPAAEGQLLLSLSRGTDAGPGGGADGGPDDGVEWPGAGAPAPDRPGAGGPGTGGSGLGGPDARGHDDPARVADRPTRGGGPDGVAGGRGGPDRRGGADRTWAVLTCRPDGGTHPHAAAACAALRRSGGNIGAMPVRDTMCTKIYAPVVAEASGTWNGAEVRFRKTYANACELAARTDAVFELDQS